MSLFDIRILYVVVVLGFAYFVGRDSFGFWLVWMTALFLFWYVGLSIRNQRKQKEGHEFIKRWNEKQPKPNRGAVAEIGDIISYRLADGFHPIRKMTIMQDSSNSWGHILVGCQKGDHVPIPFGNEGYKEIIIADIEKGYSVRQE